MSLYRESKLSWIERFCINILKSGQIPHHVAFIMDGNRRFAIKKGIEKFQGHAFGFEKIVEILGWCQDLSITEVTLYTFSIENFKRPKEEVDCLLDLVREKFKILLSEIHRLDKLGVCLRIFGDISLLPIDLQKLMAEAVLCTYNNRKTYLNMSFAYTSREEITNAVKEIASEVVQNNLKPCDVNEGLINRALYTSKNSDPDIIIRTSGEIRLSDFLLWQGSYSVLSFFKVMWPEFSIWHLFIAVLQYQHYFNDLKKIKERHAIELQHCEDEDDISFAKEEIENKKDSGPENDLTDVAQVLEQVDTRRKNFMNHLDSELFRRLVKIRDSDTIQNDTPIS